MVPLVRARLVLLGTAVAVGVAVGVSVAVSVGTIVSVGVAVGRLSRVAVSVAVTVGVAVAGTVGVAVGRRSQLGCRRSQSRRCCCVKGCIQLALPSQSRSQWPLSVALPLPSQSVLPSQ